MRKLFNIDQDEKNRILEMHENATKRHYLNETGVAFAGGEPNGFKMETTEQSVSEQDSVVPTAQAKLVNYNYSLPFKVDQNIFPTQDSFDSLVGSMSNVPAFQEIERTILLTCRNGKCLNSFLQSPLGKVEVTNMPESMVDRTQVTNNTLFPGLVAAAIVSSIRGGKYSPDAARENFNFLKVNTNSLGGVLSTITGNMFKSAVDGTIELIKSGEFEKIQPSAGVKIG
jgi:hypothetical protein